MLQRFGGTGFFPLIVAGLCVTSAVTYRTLRPSPGAAPAPVAPPSAESQQEAIASLQRRAEAQPNGAAAWSALAHARFAVGDYAGAATAYDRLTTIAPDTASGWAALGEARTLAANAVTGPAHDAFTRAVALDPKEPRGRYFLGVEKDVAGDHRGAVEDWLGVLRDAPPGAPYAESVRRLLVEVGARERIDVTDRLPPPAPTPATPSVSGNGENIAASGIPGPSPAQMAQAAQLSPSQQDALAREMVAKLAARLAGSPRDVDGWIRLMRAQSVLGDRNAAERALADGRRAFAGDVAATTTLLEAARRLDILSR